MMARSTCRPRMSAKDNVESKNEPPGLTVTVCFPALTSCGSSVPSTGNDLPRSSSANSPSAASTRRRPGPAGRARVATSAPASALACPTTRANRYVLNGFVGSNVWSFRPSDWVLTAVSQPFDVAPGSRGPLIATLTAALVVIAALAAWLARVLQGRRGTRPQ